MVHRPYILFFSLNIIVMKKIIITEGQYKKCILKEYLDKFNMIPLKKYLNMSENEKLIDLLYHYSYKVEDAILSSFNQKMADILINDLQRKGEEVFYNDLVNKRLYGEKTLKTITHFLNHIAYTDQKAPSWYHMEYEQDIHNEWLVHFSNDAYSIASQGFKHGTDDLTTLSYTHTSPNKNDDLVGYNFAYDANDFEQYYLSRATLPKYGNELVLFRASGVKVWHTVDQEYQVVFYGPSAHDFVYIGEDMNTSELIYAVYTKDGDMVYRTENIPDAVSWVINNYDQYTSKITNRKPEELRKKYETNYGGY